LLRKYITFVIREHESVTTPNLHVIPMLYNFQEKRPFSAICVKEKKQKCMSLPLVSTKDHVARVSCK